MSATAKHDQATLTYALQACVNLEQLFTALADSEAVRHYQQRQHEIARAIDRELGNRKSEIANRKSK